MRRRISKNILEGDGGENGTSIITSTTKNTLKKQEKEGIGASAAPERLPRLHLNCCRKETAMCLCGAPVSLDPVTFNLDKRRSPGVPADQSWAGRARPEGSVEAAGGAGRPALRRRRWRRGRCEAEQASLRREVGRGGGRGHSVPPEPRTPERRRGWLAGEVWLRTPPGSSPGEIRGGHRVRLTLAPVTVTAG